jgi:hypothetical protein
MRDAAALHPAAAPLQKRVLEERMELRERQMEAPQLLCRTLLSAAGPSGCRCSPGPGAPGPAGTFQPRHDPGGAGSCQAAAQSPGALTAEDQSDGEPLRSA